jgi:hypothetical protein
MMTADVLLYVAQFAVASLYAYVLEVTLQRRYEPRGTWMTVVVGTALVGLLVAARLALAPLPTITGEGMAWYVWWIVTYSFVASGSPIIIWQLALRNPYPRRTVVRL